VRTIELDASRWTTPLEFKEGSERTKMCGSNVNAINELMIWGLGAGEVPPPYIVKISRASAAPKEVQDYVALQARSVQKARAEKKTRDGRDVNVSIEY